MIRVDRPGDPPEVLKNRGVQDRDRLCMEFDADPAAYKAWEKKRAIKSTIYGHASVKESLRAAQHGKCAFCESKVAHVAHGDIEHFRPKGGYRQGSADALSRPGYYWLAYEWTNLLFSCQLCNQQHKRNLFPLADPRKRAKNHHDSISLEDPLLVDPAVDDPAEHIGFREEVAFARQGSRKGKATIDSLGLNRPAIQEARRRLLYLTRTRVIRSGTSGS